jgi:hypothetical protein
MVNTFLSRCRSLAKSVTDTVEGLDTFMSLLYYSRMRITTQLLPLLLASSLPAHIVSVFGPGRDQKWIPTDLSLRSLDDYGFMSSGSHAAYFTTFFMEHLAAQHPGKLALTHYHPGLVLGKGFANPALPWWFRAIFKYFGPLIKLMPMALDGPESGQRTLFNVTNKFPARATGDKAVNAKNGNDIEVAESSDGIVGGGAYRVAWNGEQVATPKNYVELRAEGWLQKTVEHTLKAWEVIESGKVFTD